MEKYIYECSKSYGKEKDKGARKPGANVRAKPQATKM